MHIHIYIYIWYCETRLAASAQQLSFSWAINESKHKRFCACHPWTWGHAGLLMIPWRHFLICACHPWKNGHLTTLPHAVWQHSDVRNPTAKKWTVKTLSHHCGPTCPPLRSPAKPHDHHHLRVGPSPGRNHQRGFRTPQLHHTLSPHRQSWRHGENPRALRRWHWICLISDISPSCVPALHEGAREVEGEPEVLARWHRLPTHPPELT